MQLVGVELLAGSRAALVSEAGVQTHPQKFWFGENPIKTGQNLWEPLQTPWKFEQKWRPNWHHSFLFEVMFVWFFFGQVWENSVKIPSQPQTFACTYTSDGQIF